MLRKFISIFILLLSILSLVAQNTNLRYEQNKGQWNKLINYKADFKQGKIYILDDKINILILDSTNTYYHPHQLDTLTNRTEKYTIFSIKPLNTKSLQIESKDQLSYYTNYFLSNEPTNWTSKVASFQTIVYKDIYENIDWEIASDNNRPKHSFIVHKGGKVENIKTLYKGLDNIIIRDNKLILQTKQGTIEEDELLVYQYNDNKIVKIDANYILNKTIDGYEVSYSIKNYDNEKDLIIDPSLVFSTYSGSHSDNWGMTSCYDKRGYMISGGIVEGSEYPTTEGAYDTTYANNWDCVITKYDSLGENMLFSTYIGGNMCEMPHSMIVNNSNEILVFGTTGSADFPTTENAFQTEFKGGGKIAYQQSLVFNNGIDIFVSAFSFDGTSLNASTFVGGTSNDGFNYKSYYGSNAKTLYDGNDSLYANFGDCARGEIVIDKDNNVYVASCTFSTDFPTTQNAYSTVSNGKQEAVVFKLDHLLTTLLYSTYLGGTSDDAAYSLDIDNSGRAFVCGGTTSNNFPTTPNAYSTTYNGGSTDAFLCVLDPIGESVEYATLFGSDVYDQAFFVRLDKQSNPYIFGQTKATGSTLIHNAQYAIPNSGQFVAKFTPTLDSLFFSTVFGSGDGMLNISPSGLAIDNCDRIYLAGWGRVFKYRKTSFGYTSLGTTNLETTSDAYLSKTDGMDFYILSLSKDAESLDYATFFGEVDSNVYIGNDHVDGGTSRFDKYGNLYLSICASCGGSQKMPTTSTAYSTTNNADNCNLGSVKFSIHDDFAVADFDCKTVECNNKTIKFNNYSRGTTYQWNFGDGSPTSSLKEPTHTYTNGGTYIVELIVNQNDGCKTFDTLTKQILILDNESSYLDTLSTCLGKKISIGIEDLITTYLDTVTFTWSPAELLSDPHSPSPYATLSTPTLFTLIVEKEGCKDTLYRYVDIDTMQSELPDTISFCSIPFTYLIPNTLNRKLIASWDRDFKDTIPLNNNSIIINTKDKPYIYVRYSLNGCYGVDSVYLDFSGIKATVETTDAGCKGEKTGKAEVKLQVENSEVHYQWSCSEKDTSFVDSLESGTYSVRIYTLTDTCSTTITFTIAAITTLDVQADITDALCVGVDNGKIKITVLGGDTPTTYLWSNNATTDSITNLSVGTYSVTITDSKGCKDTKTYTISASYDINLDLTATQNNCPDGCSAVITSSVTNATLPITYLWSNSQTTKDLYDVCNGDYALTVVDSIGCKQNANIAVSDNNLTTDFTAWTDKYLVYDGATVNLYSTLIEGFDYYWTPTINITNPNLNNTSATVFETTIFNVLATDNKGCKVSDTVKVDVDYIACNKEGIFLPNIFSPNNDNKNDILYVTSDYIETMDFIIYNRWGEKVFHSTNQQDGWDGKYNNSDCSAGVYYYKLEVKCIGGKTFITKGDITLVR